MSAPSPSTVSPFVGLRRRAPGPSNLDDARAVRLQAAKKAQATRERHPAYFAKADYAAYDDRLNALANAGSLAARDARIIFRENPITKRSGFIGLAPGKYLARELVNSLCRVNAFGTGLERLYEMAEIPMPAGAFAEITTNQLVEAIRKLQALQDGGAAVTFNIPVVIELLRAARYARGMARIYADRDDASALADALHTVGASKFVVNRLDTMAGRTGFRRAA